MNLMFWYSPTHANYLCNVTQREYMVVISGVTHPYTAVSFPNAQVPMGHAIYRWPDYQPIGIATLHDVKVA